MTEIAASVVDAVLCLARRKRATPYVHPSRELASALRLRGAPGRGRVGNCVGDRRLDHQHVCLNWFFLPPTHTFQLRDGANWLALAVYLVTAVVLRGAWAPASG